MFINDQMIENFAFSIHKNHTVKVHIFPIYKNNIRLKKSSVGSIT